MIVKWSKYDGWAGFDLGNMQDEKHGGNYPQSRVQKMRPAKINRNELESFMDTVKVDSECRNLVVGHLDAAGL